MSQKPKQSPEASQHRLSAWGIAARWIPLITVLAAVGTVAFYVHKITSLDADIKTAKQLAENAAAKTDSLESRLCGLQKTFNGEANVLRAAVANSYALIGKGDRDHGTFVEFPLPPHHIEHHAGQHKEGKPNDWRDWKRLKFHVKLKCHVLLISHCRAEKIDHCTGNLQHRFRVLSPDGKEVCQSKSGVVSGSYQATTNGTAKSVACVTLNPGYHDLIVECENYPYRAKIKEGAVLLIAVPHKAALSPVSSRTSGSS